MKQEMSPFAKNRRISPKDFHMMRHQNTDMMDLIFAINPDAQYTDADILHTFNSLPDAQKDLLWQESNRIKEQRMREEAMKQQMEMQNPEMAMQMRQQEAQMKMMEQGQVPSEHPYSDMESPEGMQDPNMNPEQQEDKPKFYQFWKKSWRDERRKKKIKKQAQKDAERDLYEQEKQRHISEGEEYNS